MPAGVLLAAGGGRRFGHPKALVEFRGEPLVRRGVRLLRDGGCDPIVVVVGARAGTVRSIVETADGRAVVVDNPAWRSGMGSSLRAALRTLSRTAPPSAGAVIALVDQPLVAPVAVRRLIDVWHAGATIAAAAYGEQVRNPVLLDASMWAAAARRATGDAGARALLREHPDWVRAVPCADVATADDIDTVADLRALADRPDPNPAGARDRRDAKEQPWS